MSSALAQVYALQQRELNEKERHRQRQIAKKQRLVAAFNASGLLAIFNEFRSLPLRTDVRQRVYKSTVADLTWHADTPAAQLDSMAFIAINGSSSGPRWWCQENADSGNMFYCYSSGQSGDLGTEYTTPHGEWLNQFIAYLAYAADPQAVETKMQTAHTNGADAPVTPRRQVQPV